MSTPSAKPPAPLIELIEVSLAHPEQPSVPVVEGVNWRVMPGDLWVVGGLHGTGKSVLLSVAAGIDRPTAGEMRLRGRNISHLTEHELSRELLSLGLVFDNDGRLFTRLTVSENVALPLRYRHNWTAAEAEGKVQQVLESLGLGSVGQVIAGRLIHNLRQRVGLARALALKPELLLVDNPLSRLDARESRWWIDFMRQLAAGHPLLDNRPLTVVLAADDLRPWLDWGRQFALLEGKRFQVLGDRAALEGSREPALKELLPPAFSWG